MARSPDELKAAVESMFRIRAVESPPDANGLRRIWHRGTRGAELVTEVDATGRVLRQDFTLFDDQLSWHRERGFSTAAVKDASGNPAAKPARDLLPHAVSDAEVVGRAAASLQHYTGNDRFLEHLREQVLAQQGGAMALGDAVPITGAAMPRLTEPVVAPAPVRWAWLIAAALALAAVGLFLLLRN